MQKRIGQNSASIHDKNSYQDRHKKKNLNTRKAIYGKSIVNIRLNSGRLKAFSLRSEIRQGHFCPVYFKD